MPIDPSEHVQSLSAAIRWTLRRGPSAESRHPLLTGVVAIGLALGDIGSASAAIFTVSTNGDPGAGGLSLRNAIALANAGSGDVINFDASLNGSTITLTQGQLLIANPMTILGPGADQMAISGGNASRIFSLNIPSSAPFGTVTIAGLTLTGGIGAPGGNGGAAIVTYDTALVLLNSVVSGNSACTSAIAVINQFVGALDSSIANTIIRDNGCSGLYKARVPLSIVDSVISGNTSSRGGGGIYCGKYCHLNIARTTISGNHATGTGGGISVPYGADLTIDSSRISGNTSEQSGGGIDLGDNRHYSAGSLTLTRTTVSGNGAARNGSGISVHHGNTITLSQSTISHNEATDTQYGPAGGGLSLQAVAGQTLIDNCTLYGNYAASGAGIAILDAGTGDRVRIAHSTISGNFTNYYEASNGILGNGQPAIVSSIIANNFNHGGNEDLSGTFSVGYSLIENPGSATISGFAIITGTDPQLGPLRSNGGPTLTLLPAVTSPVRDVGDLVPGVDQRGLPRVVNGRNDMGAVERQAVEDFIFRNGFDSD